MPRKIKFKAWMGLFLIGIMLFSTFAYAVIQSFNPQQTLELPETNIVEYSLNPNLKTALVQYGRTIITFDYNLGCENCVNQKAVLEFVANEYQQQVFLEELRDESLQQSQIKIVSAYGTRELANANETEILNALCALMISPPVTCALQ